MQLVTTPHLRGGSLVEKKQLLLHSDSLEALELALVADAEVAAAEQGEEAAVVDVVAEGAEAAGEAVVDEDQGDLGVLGVLDGLGDLVRDRHPNVRRYRVFLRLLIFQA